MNCGFVPAAMPKCIFRTCPHYTGRKCFYPGITLHVFPRELRLVKLWLQQTGQYYDDLDALAEKIASSKMGSYRMCSAHFDPKCYSSQGAKSALKPDAVPTIFPGNVVPYTVDVKHMPQRKKLRPLEKAPDRGSHCFHVDAATSTDHNAQKDVGTQTEFTRGTYQYCVSSMPPWLMQDRGVQWPEYEFNYHGEDWKVQMDHMYCSSRLKWVRELPADVQDEFLKDRARHRSRVRQHVSSQSDCGFIQQLPVLEESEPPADLETPEGYFFSKCSIRNKRTLCTLQTKLVALFRHMVDAPHTGSYKRSRTRKLLNQIVEIVCLMVGEDLKLVNMNKEISKFYQKQGEVPVRYQDVAVFFTKEEWQYVEENIEIYKKDILGDPTESKDDLYDYILDELDEDVDIPDDYFFKLLNVSLQGATQPALPRGRKKKKIQPNIVTNVPENIFEEESHEDGDWNNNGNCSLEYFSVSLPDNEDTKEEKERCRRLVDVCPIADVVKEETVSDHQDFKPDLQSIKTEAEFSTDDVKEETLSDHQDFDPVLKSMKTESDCSTDDSTGWNETSDSHKASASTLWIAEDGTTSTQWTPQQASSSAESVLKRPKGRRKKPKELVTKHVAAPDTGGAACDAAQDGLGSPQHSGDLPRDTMTSSGHTTQQIPMQEIFRCYICKNCFSTKVELRKHQTTHREEPQKCDECPSAFDFRADLDRHKAKKHNKLRYPCEICGLQYNYQSQYIIHYRTHTGEKPFPCKECGQSFGHKCSLILHMKKHSGSSMYKCGRCGKLMDSDQALEKHRKLRFCVSCKKCFTRRALRRHLRMHKSGESGEHVS